MHGDRIVLTREVDEDYISPSEKDCLDSVIAEHGNMGVQELSNLSRDGAYDAVINRDGMGAVITVMDMAATLGNAEILMQHIADPNPGGYDNYARGR